MLGRICLYSLFIAHVGAFSLVTSTDRTYQTELNAYHEDSSSRSSSLNDNNGNIITSSDRRNAIKSIFFTTAGIAASSFVSSASAVDDDLTRGGVPLTPFNGLAFQYRGGTKDGLDASTLNEPTISYPDFLIRLDKDEVEFVEFLAPNGDAAYVTFKSTSETGAEEKMKPIRIGEGYPIEDPEGWSSPAFVVKAVKKRGVAYKFTVPMLEKYR